MWEGQATTRKSQIIAGVLLALLSFPFLTLGGIGLLKLLNKPDPKFEIVIAGLVCLFIGLFCFTLAYRLISARGVNQGGGIMSPVAFKAGGYLFIALSLFFSFYAVKGLNYVLIIGVVASLFIAYIFFIAARHRGAMRNLK